MVEFTLLAERDLRPLPAVTIDPRTSDPGQNDRPGRSAFSLKMDRRVRSQTYPRKSLGNMRESGVIVGQSCRPVPIMPLQIALGRGKLDLFDRMVEQNEIPSRCNRQIREAVRAGLPTQNPTQFIFEW